jgi:hypothetical protein
MAVPSIKPARATRKPAAPWSQPSQFRRSLPMLRLLTAISSIPEVAKIEMLVDGAGTYLHVLMREEVREAEHRIYHAERDYLNATELHSFDLHVTPMSRVPSHILEAYRLAGYETVLDR